MTACALRLSPNSFFRSCCHFSDQLCILLVSPVPLELKLWMYFSNRSISHYQLLKNSSDLPCCEPAIVHVSEQIRYFVESQPNVSDRERPNLLTSVRKFPLGIQTMFGRGEFSCDLPCRREKNSFRDAALRTASESNDPRDWGTATPAFGVASRAVNNI